MPEPAATAVFVGSQAAAFAGLAATAYLLGRLLTKRLPLAPGLERAAVAVAAGLAGLAHVGILLGLIGWLTRPAVVAVLAAVLLAGWQGWRELGDDLRAAGGGHPIGMGLGAGVVVGPLFLLALYPPTAFDATLYHLPFARAFAASGALPFLPHLRFPVFPVLNELLFTGMLLVDRDVGAHLVELLATLATAALLVGWDGRRWSGRLGAAAFLGNPIVVGLGTSAYVEPGLTLFAAVALYAALRYRRSGERGWVALAAASAGAAAATKYLGLFFLLAAGVAVAARRGAEPRRRGIDVLLFAVVAGAILLPWYGRIVWYTGNPVFPYFAGLFGDSPWTLPRLWNPGMRPGWLAALLRLPWDVLFARARAGSAPPFSPAYLLALPLLLLAAVRDRRVRGLLGLAAGYALLYSLLPPDARYLAPLLPLLSLALGAALLTAPWLARWRRGLAAAALLLVLPGWAYASYRIALQGPLPATAAARARYLGSHLPLYPALAALDRRCGDRYTVYVFFAENMRYYAAGTFLGDWFGPERFATLLPAAGDPDALAGRLTGLGAGFALVPRHQTGIAVPATPAWRRRFLSIYSDPAAEVFAVVDGGQPAAVACQR